MLEVVAREATRHSEDSTMLLRNLIFYSIVGGILWAIADRLGAGLGVNLAISLLVPPFLIIAYTLYKNRGPLL